MNPDRLLQRFLEYVRIDTTADPSTKRYPSSAGQLELGRLLVAQLHAMGLENAAQDEHGLVLATLPGNVGGDVPVVALNAHLDTSPETPGANIQPQVVRNYAGGDLPLSGADGQVIRAAENPELDKLVGCTLITTDGTTLLGADDKAGVAVIMEAAAFLMEHPETPHGPVRILFTCDEEIGRGVEHVDVTGLAATVCYTLDGPGANQIDVETFSADVATVQVRGVNIHPSIAKDRMVNAVRAASRFIEWMPRDTLAPEATTDREGFMHPYRIDGGVAEVQLSIILRDFDTPALAEQTARLQRIAEQVMQEFPGSQVAVSSRPQYRNLGDGLRAEPRAVEYAEAAHRNLGRQARRTIIRGGTDGSQLTERGLPTPNLSCGQHNPHSPLEWACLDEMVQAQQVVVELLKTWATP